MTYGHYEETLMKSMTINLGLKQRTGEQHYEDDAYKALDSLVRYHGFRDREIGTDYYIKWLEDGRV